MKAAKKLPAYALPVIGLIVAIACIQYHQLEAKRGADSLAAYCSTPETEPFKFKLACVSYNPKTRN